MVLRKCIGNRNEKTKQKKTIIKANKPIYYH